MAQKADKRPQIIAAVAGKKPGSVVSNTLNNNRITKVNTKHVLKFYSTMLEIVALDLGQKS